MLGLKNNNIWRRAIDAFRHCKMEYIKAKGIKNAADKCSV
jgi:hypothetical protein